MVRLMPVVKEGVCQEGDYFLEKVVFVLSPLGRMGFQQVEKWGKKGAKAQGPAIQGWGVCEL